jgi:hypothetical protein
LLIFDGGVDSVFSAVSAVPICLKKKYLLCILIHIIIYISDIIISIIYISLITPGGEIRHQERMGRDPVLLFSIIGKENGRTENTLSPFHPRQRVISPSGCGSVATWGSHVAWYEIDLRSTLLHLGIIQASLILPSA